MWANFRPASLAILLPPLVLTFSFRFLWPLASEYPFAAPCIVILSFREMVNDGTVFYIRIKNYFQFLLKYAKFQYISWTLYMITHDRV